MNMDKKLKEILQKWHVEPRTIIFNGEDLLIKEIKQLFKDMVVKAKPKLTDGDGWINDWAKDGFIQGFEEYEDNLLAQLEDNNEYTTNEEYDIQYIKHCRTCTCKI